MEVGPNDAAFPEADVRVIISCEPDDVILVCSILKYVLMDGSCAAPVTQPDMAYKGEK